MRELNRDTYEIKNYELTPQGYLNCWVTLGVAGKEMVYNRDGREIKEYIKDNNLFNPGSVNTAIGKPIVLNHAPQAVNSSNHSKFAKGTLLQQFDRDGNDLVMAAVVHDADVVKGVMDGKIKYTSSTYWSNKQLNADGSYEQLGRDYEDLAFLTEEYVPRAGNTSNVKIKGNNDSSDDNKQPNSTQANNQQTVNTQTDNQQGEQMNTDTFDKNEFIAKLNLDAQEKIELLSTWKPILDKNKKAIRYDASSHDIKRDILSCFYPEKTIKALHNDSVLEGFWLNFVVNADSSNNPNKDSLPVTGYGYSSVPNTNSYQLNYDAAMEQEREKLRKEREGVK